MPHGSENALRVLNLNIMKTGDEKRMVHRSQGRAARSLPHMIIKAMEMGAEKTHQGKTKEVQSSPLVGSRMKTTLMSSPPGDVAT